jgi:hypothetical protein
LADPLPEVPVLDPEPELEPDVLPALEPLDGIGAPGPEGSTVGVGVAAGGFTGVLGGVARGAGVLCAGARVLGAGCRGVELEEGGAGLPFPVLFTASVVPAPWFFMTRAVGLVAWAGAGVDAPTVVPRKPWLPASVPISAWFPPPAAPIAASAEAATRGAQSVAAATAIARRVS